MAGDSRPVLSDAARALAARCEHKVNEIARSMTTGAFADLPGYAELPADMKDGELAATARHGLRLFLRRVVHGGPAERAERAGRGDFDRFRERAAQRAEEGLPLHLVLRSHLRGTTVLWRALREVTRPGEEAALAELADVLIGIQEGIVGAVSETYLDEQSTLAAERREERRSLVRALLDGSLPPGRFPAARLGLADGALVLALGFPAEDVPGRPPEVAHRRSRRAQAALDRAFGTEVAALLDDTGGHAVVPGALVPVGDEGLLSLLRRACSADVRLAAVQAAGPEDIPGAARTASEVLRVARAGGLPPGLHRLDDVLLEYHLSRRDESSERIAALLDPIAGRQDLVETLRTYLGSRQERRSTARQLGLHPNTVDNRLARIAELTGLDLAAPHGIALALAALLLRDAAG
ncbi:helix-turn-helix domain-containing protein [Streptomyces sp. NPDC026673]|uniref:PucR family transcriptional regulator n=1 Tax=Streptomyces sp. NPDC026673 TaxID=3155724 RepID=UPI0033CB2E9D